MYIGNDLQIAHPSYKIIDDISSGFNGSAVSFALQVNGESPVPFPISTQQVTISVNGVIQEPDPSGSAGFKLLGSNIVFSSAPANGHAFFGVINAGADYVTAGSEFPDGNVTSPSFTFQADQDTGWFRSGSGAVNFSANGVNKVLFDGNGLTVTGTCTATAFSGNGANLTNIAATSVGTLASLTVTGDVTVDTNTLKVDATNNRVGIGTTSPSSILHCQPLDETNFLVRNEGSNVVLASETNSGRDNNRGLDFEATQFTFIEGGSEKARLDSSGRLLLGTTTAGHANADDLTIGSTTANSRGGLTINAANNQDGNIHFGDSDSNLSGIISYNHSNNEFVFYTSATLALTLNSSQNATFAGDIALADGKKVNIGGNSDLHLIHNGTDSYIQNITGDLYIQNTSGTSDDITITAADDVYIRSQGGEAAIHCKGDGAVDIYHNATRKFYTSAAGVYVEGTLTTTGTVSDSKGNLRSIPYQDETGSTHTLIAADAGKTVGANNGVTIPASVLGAGDAVTIICHSGSDITLTQGSGLSLYNTADASTGNRTLAARGMATVYFVSATVAYISGAGLS